MIKQVNLTISPPAIVSSFKSRGIIEIRLFGVNPTSLQASVQLHATTSPVQKKLKVDFDSENSPTENFVNLPNVRLSAFEIEVDRICHLFSESSNMPKLDPAKMSSVLQTIIFRGLPCHSNNKTWITGSLEVADSDSTTPLPITDEDVEIEMDSGCIVPQGASIPSLPTFSKSRTKNYSKGQSKVDADIDIDSSDHQGDLEERLPPKSSSPVGAIETVIQKDINEPTSDKLKSASAQDSDNARLISAENAADYASKIWNPNFPFYYSLNFGDWIEVKWGNYYYYARALYYHVDVNGQIRLRIHYAGWPRSDDADIALNDDTIRPYDPTETLKDDLVKPRKQDPESNYQKKTKIPGISSSTVAAQIRDRGYGVLIGDQPFSDEEKC
jgi:hypothetical protein